jgi:uncharacterized protein YjbI with pentapeptide repeats
MPSQSQLHSPELSPEEPRQPHPDIDPQMGSEMADVSQPGLPEGLVPADQLPSAAAMLAELFPTEEPLVAPSSDDLHNALNASHHGAAEQDAERFSVEIREIDDNWPLTETTLREEIHLPLAAASPGSATVEFEKAAEADPALSQTFPAQQIDVSLRDSNRSSRRRKSASASVFAGIGLRVKNLLRGATSKRSPGRTTSEEAASENPLEASAEISPETSIAPVIAESSAAENSPQANSVPAFNDFPNAVADAIATPLEILADIDESSAGASADRSLSALDSSPALARATTATPIPAAAMVPASEDITVDAAGSTINNAINPTVDSIAHPPESSPAKLPSQPDSLHQSAPDSPSHLESRASSSAAPDLGRTHNPDRPSLSNSISNPGEQLEPSREEFASTEAIEGVDTSDDDLAIASAIERYANITVHSPVKASQLSANREISEPTGFTQSPAPKHEEAPREEIQVDLNALLGIERDTAPADPILGYTASVDIPDIDELPKRNLSPKSNLVPGGNVTNVPILREFVPEQPIPVAIEETASSEKPYEQTPDAPDTPPATPYRDWSFEEKLASHHEWLESKGKTGKKAEFAGTDLEGTELIGVDLRYLDLHDANLRATDLLMADLRDACLSRANFRDACLVGANLEGANLEGATLDTAMGLVPRQFAGTNLHDATLPAHILAFDALAEFRRASLTVNGFFAALLSLSVLSWLIIWMTRDFQLITNSAILPFLHSSTAAASMPTQQFYLIAPFALFIVYLVFHFHLQRLWDLSLELPAVFPDGKTLGESEPRIVLGLLRTHFRWMNQEATSTRIIEKSLSVLIAYWVVPATLFFYWLRFLTLQNVHGTALQMFLVAGATGAALYSTTKTGKPAETWTLQENTIERIVAKCKQINPVTASLVVLGTLAFLSAGTMAGVPHGKESAPQFMSGSIRRWAPSVLWAFGVDPYADITEAVISTKPANWNGSDEQVSSVKGARLNDSNFRYAQAYRVFLANAHLLHAKFQGAFLSQADLRSADLGQSDLRYAILDQSLLSHANLDRAVLDGANLSRADIHAANLSYASLAGATLVDARLDGATLYGAKLPSATLIRTNFEKADLRESHLEGANLEHADMQAAYLWSAKLAGARLTNAQLGTAIFVDANLRGADLRWAQLHGTVLTGSDLTGALLDGADFRGAVGFGPDQICSAKSRRGLLLDDPMQAQVTAQCGAVR